MRQLEDAQADASVARESWITVACLGILAGALADVTHEVLGHTTVALLAGDHVTLLSSVGMQTRGEPDRLMSAAGTGANLLVGTATMLFLHQRPRAPTDAGAYFLLLFAVFNLFNAAYLVFSGLLQQGDWATVIAGLSPLWLWRGLLVLAGVVLYRAATLWAGRVLASRFSTRGITRGQLHKLLLVPYLSAAVVMIAASIFNPFARNLILISGVGASLGINWGLLRAGSRVLTGPGEASRANNPVKLVWVAAALIVGGLFVAVLGPGICLDCTVSQR